MKILIVHYRYYMSGGPERYLFNIINELENKGHKVVPFSVSNSKNNYTKYEKYFANDIGENSDTYFEEYNRNIKTMLRVVSRQFYSFSVKRKLKRLIKDEKPQVCYLLHFINKLSPSVIDACKEMNVPVAMRVSDFFMLCPNALLYKNGNACEDCCKKGLFSAVKKKCVKNSYMGSFIKYLAYKLIQIRKVYKNIDVIFCPSKNTMEIIKKYTGLNNVKHLPSFQNITNVNENKVKKNQNYVLYFGRIEQEKGIEFLIKTYLKIETNTKLFIVGKSSTGYEVKVRKLIQTKDNMRKIQFIGFKSGKELERYIQESKFVIFPQEWYENLPNTFLESLAFKKPVLMSDIGFFKEIDTKFKIGLKYKTGCFNDFKNKFLTMDSMPKEKLYLMGEEGYKLLKEKYSKKIHVSTLIDELEQLI